MKPSITAVITAFALTVCCAISAVPGAIAAETAPPPALRPELLKPVKLDYKASKFFITATTSVALAARPAAQVMPDLAVIKEKAGLQPDSDAVIVESITTSVLGRDTAIEVLMNPDSRVLQISSVKSGHKDRYRLYRYFSDSTYSIKRFPANKSELKAGWPNWTIIEEDLFPIAEDNRNLLITEAEGLFYVVSVLDWRNISPEHAIVLFDTDGLIELSMDFLGEQTVSTDYEEIDTSGGTSRIKGEVAVQQIRIDGRPLDPSANKENFNFLNYKGAVDLFVDKKKGIVIEMRGDLDYVGEVSVKLQSADYRTP
jgi:hypothetical protein